MSDDESYVITYAIDMLVVAWTTDMFLTYAFQNLTFPLVIFTAHCCLNEFLVHNIRNLNPKYVIIFQPITLH